MVSFELDDFIKDADRAYWIATLSDGRTVYQDDERPGYEEPRAWVRLKNFCEENNLFVKQLRLRFRSHEESIPPSEEGYFCRNRIRSLYGNSTTQRTKYGLSAGPIIDGKIHAYAWIMPEIIKDDIDPLEIREIDGYEDSIIWNKQSSAFLQAQKKSVSQPTI